MTEISLDRTRRLVIFNHADTMRNEFLFESKGDENKKWIRKGSFIIGSNKTQTITLMATFPEGGKPILKRK